MKEQPPEVNNARFVNLAEAVEWLRNQPRVFVDRKHRILTVTRQSLRLNGCLDYLTKQRGVRVLKFEKTNTKRFEHDKTIVEGLGGLLQ